MWEHLLGQSDVATYVIEDAGAIVAFMSARRVESPVHALEMAALYVLPDRFRRGTGTRLHAVFESARRDGEIAVLDVWEGNSRAIVFYRRHGWTATSQTRPGPHGQHPSLVGSCA